ncbi:MAG TPA: GTPase Era [Actinomycetaceae bacterium]|nr:GTPase Era [Actinomycetaceae bacterium]
MDPSRLAALGDGDWPEDLRAGFVAIVGRPNAGKSTLINAMVGEKIAIISNRPETTRRAIRGVVHREAGQLVLVDTPGLHKPRTLLGQRLNEVVHESLDDVDAVIVCLPADEKIGPGDRFVTNLAFRSRAPVVAAVTKIDRVRPEQLIEKLLAVSELADFAEIVPVSAVRGEQVEKLVDLLVGIMPESPPLYPREQVTDESDEIRVAELIREAALEGVRDELPHSIAVVVDDVEEREGKGGRPGVLAIYASLYVERDSQKAIVIGRRGTRLREVGTRARHEIEELLQRRVYLDLHVKVAQDWQRDPKKLGRLGF